jgi:HK97 family phage major capsid protein
VEALEPGERKALVVNNDSRGGYLAPAQMVADVLREVREFSPIRQMARNLATSAGEIDWPKLTEGPTARWVGEVETRSETSTAFGMFAVPLDELACYVVLRTTVEQDTL